jgi:hypothetical protein
LIISCEGAPEDRETQDPLDSISPWKMTS